MWATRFGAGSRFAMPTKWLATHHSTYHVSVHIHVARFRGVANQIDGGLNAAVNAKSKEAYPVAFNS